jgi:aminopeptidase N
MKASILSSAILMLVFGCSSPKQTSETHPDPAKDSNVQRTERKVYRDAYPLVNDLEHTKLEVKFDWQKKYLYGKATITLHPHFYATDSLTLNARGMNINEVSLLKNRGFAKLDFSYDSLLIRIKLDKEYRKDESYTVFIDYTSKPDELPEGGSNAITKDKGLYFINADGSDPDKPKEIWTQGETQSNSAWFPTIENPAQRMTQEIYMTVDTNYKTLSNGLLITSTDNHDGTRTDYWKQSLPAAPYLSMMVVGDFAIVKDHWRNIEVNYYVEHDYEQYANMIFGHTPEMLEFYSEKLGVPFVWEKYSQVVVRDYVSGAMENASAVVHREGMQQTYREYMDDNLEDYICHELFHHWFGDLVTCESWSNMVLNEGFANYGEYLWFEHKFGRDYADYRNQLAQSAYLKSSATHDPDVIRFDYGDREEMYDAVSYSKGGRILHMLRKYVGDEAFFASLNYYLESHQFSSVEIHDLRLAFEKITGEDLNWFFNEWYLNHGKPSLKIDYAWSDSLKKETVTIEQTQDLQKNPLYKIPLLVDVYSNGKVDRKKILIEKIKEDFTFSLLSKPDLVNVDAEKMLLCTKKDNKPKEDFIFQYYHSPLYLDRFEALSQIGDSYSLNTRDAKLVEDALSDKFWNIRSMAIKNIGVLAKGEKQRIQAKLIAMSLMDDNSHVRAAALKAIAKNYPDDKLLPVFENALNDSSYLVMTTSFKIICDQDEARGFDLAKTLEQKNDINISVPVAIFYAEKGKEENNDFMVTTLRKAKGYDRYTLISSYSKFLSRIENPQAIQAGTDALAVIGRKASSRFARSAAVDALESLVQILNDRILKSQKEIGELKTSNASQNTILIEESKLEKIKLQRDKLRATIDDIKKNEKDKRLLKTYGNN